LLQKFYRIAGANPAPVGWGETPAAIKERAADPLDPSVGTLFVSGVKEILSHLIVTQTMPDSQVCSANQECFKALPSDQ